MPAQTLRVHTAEHGRMIAEETTVTEPTRAELEARIADLERRLAAHNSGSGAIVQAGGVAVAATSWATSTWAAHPPTILCPSVVNFRAD